MTTTGARRGRTRLLVATVAAALVAAGGLLWLADDTDWFLHRRLEGVDGVAVAGGRDGRTWVRLETSVDSRERPTVLAALSDLMQGEGYLAVGPSAGPEQPERSDGAPTTYVQLGPGTTADDLDDLAVALGALTALESLESLRDEPDRQVVIGPGAEGLEMTATVEGDPGDLPFQAVQLVRHLASADARAVTQLDLEVGIAAGAGALRATCPDGLAGPDGVLDALEDLDAAQGPGWAVGTAITCEGPSVAELLVQDAEDLAAQRRRAARVLPRDWALTVGWVGAEVSGRADVDDDPAAVLRALRERDGAQLGPLAADLSSVEVAVDDVDGLGRVLRRLERAGAGRVEVDLGEQVVAGPVGRLGPRLATLGRLEELGWEPGFVVLRDGSEVWSVGEAGADLADEADREALVGAWRAGAGPGESRYLVERPDEDGLLLPALVFDSAPGSAATEVDDLVVLRDLESREAARQVLAAWDATAGS